ncbi:MAG: xylulose kinase [Anaerolineales bacterium]|nr:xylulose kinase [Anaerolineales bacterium]
MNNSLVIGVDSSTTACKTIAWNKHGQAVAEGRASYPLLRPTPTWFEQDAEDWWRSLGVALKELLNQIDPARIEALCLTHQRESFVPVDSQGRPIRHAILWLDERTQAQLTFLAEKIGADQIHQISGKPLSMTPSLPKLVWLQQHEPEIITQAHKFLETHAFLVYRLTGQFRTSLACADPMGLVDMRKHRWSGELLDPLGFRLDQFPELVPPGEIIGQISAEAAAATGLPAGLPVVAGAGDGQCAGLGANAMGEGRAYLNMGTAVVSGPFSADYVVDRAFRTMYAPIAGTYFLETVIRSGLLTVSWFVEKMAGDLRDIGLPLSPEELLEAAAAKIPPGALGLMLVPYWTSVSTPYWDPAATGIAVGWNTFHSREHFYRAILEGIAFEQRLAGEGVMAATGQPFTEYITLGGGSRSKLWCQTMADVTGVPIVRSTTTEATCLGAGILAAVAAGWYPDAYQAAAAMTDTADQFQPNPEIQQFYERLYQEVYKPLFPTLQALLHRLTELTRHDA